jgi:hypothetical protein
LLAEVSRDRRTDVQRPGRWTRTTTGGITECLFFSPGDSASG